MTRLLAVPAVLVAFAAGGVSVADAATARIKVGDDFFSPKAKTVKKGTKLKFVWVGEDKHNVVAKGAASRRSPIQEEGVFAFKARKKGTIKLICEVHDDMKASVRVN